MILVRTFGLPRPSVTKTVKDMEKLGFVGRKKQQKRTEGLFILRRPGQERDLVDESV